MKFLYDSGDRRFLVPELTGVKKPVYNKKKNSYEYINGSTKLSITKKILESKEVRKKMGIWLTL